MMGMGMPEIDYKTILPEGWSRPRGFAHAVVSGGTRSVRISGQLGKKDGQGEVSASSDFGTQWRYAMENLPVPVRKAAGGEPKQIVMLRAYVTDIEAFKSSGAAIGEAWGATLGKHFPAMTLVQVSALIDPHARVEIEGEAILP